jgi:hypothetical protein
MARKTRGNGVDASDPTSIDTRESEPPPTARRRARRTAGEESAPKENVVRPAPRREAAAAPRPVPSPSPAPTAPPASTAPARPAAPPASDAVPERVRERFVNVGKQWYFPNGAVAFTDRGRLLVTPSENAEVVRSLVEIAQARGWDAIAVSGTERFRKEVWAAGQVAGVEVRGYRANAFEKETLARALARRRALADRVDDELEPTKRERPEEGATRRRSAREQNDVRVDGRLIEHGAAPYLHRTGEPGSYFVTVETLRGARTVWGKDLERALKDSLTQPKAGDEVRLQVVAREPVTIKRLERGDDGRSLELRTATAQRSRWVVETQEFFEERARAARTLRDATITPQRGVRERPELTGSYLVLKAADEVASRKIRDPQDRERFVALIRGALADAIERGEPLPAVRIRERARAAEPRAERDVERTR